MTKPALFKDAFTLIEVMVAVMIISVVIMALIQMYANNTHIFSSLKKQTKTNHYASLLIANDDYGFHDKNIRLNDLVKDFDLQLDLRRALKEIKVKIIYQELETIDLSEQESDTQSEASSNLGLEIGKSILQVDDTSTALMRFRIR